MEQQIGDPIWEGEEQQELLPSTMSRSTGPPEDSDWLVPSSYSVGFRKPTGPRPWRCRSLLRSVTNDAKTVAAMAVLETAAGRPW